MQITNIHNLPQAIHNAASAGIRERQGNRYSVTELISPPQMIFLKRKFWKDLKEDCSQRLWALLGQAVHMVLAGNSPEDSFSEERLEVITSGVVISGMADLWHREVVEDYKITSVYSFLLGEKIEWEQQLNLYAYLYRITGFPVNKLLIHAILRDWQQSKSYETDYPKIPFHTVEVKLWSMEQQAVFLARKIIEHTSSTPRLCTNEERWAKPTTYAAMKEGRKSALRVLDSKESIISWIKENVKEINDVYIEERKGVDVRCDHYCIVKDFCPQYKIIKSERGGTNATNHSGATDKGII